MSALRPVDALPPERADPPAREEPPWLFMVARQALYFFLTEAERRYGLDRPCPVCKRERRQARRGTEAGRT